MTDKKNKRYNGYENWDTWNLALWMSNEEKLYHKARVMAGEEGRFAKFAQWVCESLQALGEPLVWEKINVEEVRKSLIDDEG